MVEYLATVLKALSSQPAGISGFLPSLHLTLPNNLKHLALLVCE